MTDPAVKYRDLVDPAHQSAMDTVLGPVRIMLGAHRLHFEAVLEAERRAHSVGHILDPTLYRDMIQSESFARQLRVMRATIAFLDELEAVEREIARDADPACCHNRYDATERRKGIKQRLHAASAAGDLFICEAS